MEPTTFSALNAMERLGYVVRRANPRSRKEVHVYLTPKGRALKSKLVPLAEEVNEVALQDVVPTTSPRPGAPLLALIANLAADETASLATRRRMPSTRELARACSMDRGAARKTAPHGRRRGRESRRGGRILAAGKGVIEALGRATEEEDNKVAKLQLSFACGLYDLHAGALYRRGQGRGHRSPISSPSISRDRSSTGWRAARNSTSPGFELGVRPALRQQAVPRSWPSRCFPRALSPRLHRRPPQGRHQDAQGPRGKRVGVPLLTMTAAIYISGLLQQEYGVDLRRSTGCRAR